MRALGIGVVMHWNPDGMFRVDHINVSNNNDPDSVLFMRFGLTTWYFTQANKMQIWEARSAVPLCSIDTSSPRDGARAGASPGWQIAFNSASDTLMFATISSDGDVVLWEMGDTEGQAVEDSYLGTCNDSESKPRTEDATVAEVKEGDSVPNHIHFLQDGAGSKTPRHTEEDYICMHGL